MGKFTFGLNIKTLLIVLFSLCAIVAIVYFIGKQKEQETPLKSNVAGNTIDWNNPDNFLKLKSNVAGNTIDWNNPDNFLKLKTLIIMTDSSVLDTQGLLSCVAKKISENIKDQNSINPKTISYEMNSCKGMGNLNTSTSLKANDITIKEYFSAKFNEIYRRDPKERELTCILYKIINIFETKEKFEKFTKLDNDLVMTFIKIIFNTCVSLWNQDLTTLKKTTIPNVIMKLSQNVDPLAALKDVPVKIRDFTDTELDCIINKIKSRFNDPNNIKEDDLVNFLNGNIRECLWTTDQVNRIKGIMENMKEEELSTFFGKFVGVPWGKFTSEEIDCFIEILKQYFPDPSIFESARELSSFNFNIYSRCTDNRRVVPVTPTRV